MKNVIFIFLVFLGGTKIFAQLTPLPNSISETWYDKVPVSGEIRTGIMMDNSCTEKVKDSFYVQIPMSHNFNFLNVEISSNDGRYTYMCNYYIKDRNGIQILQRDTKLTSKLKNYACDDLAIMAWMSNENTAEKNNFVLANWDSNFDSSNVYIFLNSENPAILFVQNTQNNKTESLQCNEIKNAANVAYNCLCKLPLKYISEDTEISIVQRVRRSQNRYSLDIKR